MMPVLPSSSAAAFTAAAYVLIAVCAVAVVTGAVVAISNAMAILRLMADSWFKLIFVILRLCLLLVFI